jgi:hypothetical protein
MMKTVEIISKLPTVFTRTLNDGQGLCPECGGIQLVSDGKVIRSCNTCLGKNGVLSRCQYCGELLVYNHRCQGMKDAERLDRYNREMAKWAKVPKITFEEAIERFEMVFVDLGDGYYVETDMLMEWLDDRESDDEDFDRSALQVYGTYKTQIAFDAGNIIESACDDLHEEAMDRIPGDAVNELQTILDNWAKKYGGGTVTYNMDGAVGIILQPMEARQ